jgi:hypothetical protein
VAPWKGRSGASWSSIASGAYEGAVDRRIPNYPFRCDARGAAKPGPRTRRVARWAHHYYWDLVNGYDATVTTRRSTA